MSIVVVMFDARRTTRIGHDHWDDISVTQGAGGDDLPRRLRRHGRGDGLGPFAFLDAWFARSSGGLHPRMRIGRGRHPGVVSAICSPSSTAGSPTGNLNC